MGGVNINPAGGSQQTYAKNGTKSQHGKDLSGKSFSGDLSNVDFSNSKAEKGTVTFNNPIFNSGTKFTNVHYDKGVIFSGMKADHTSFANSVFGSNTQPPVPAHFYNANINAGDFTNTKFLGDVHFDSAILNAPNFTNAELSGKVAFTNATITDGNFKGATIAGSSSTPGKYDASFFQTTFNGTANFADSTIKNTLFAIALPIPVPQGKIGLDDANFTHANLTDVKFAGYSNGEALVAGRMRNADFSDSTLSNVQFNDNGRENTGADLQGSNFTKANISHSSFAYTNLNSSDRKTTFAGATISDTDFMGAKAEYVDFTGTTFNNVSLKGADLKNANFTGASFSGNVNFENALADGAKGLPWGTMTDPNTNVTGMHFNNQTTFTTPDGTTKSGADKDVQDTLTNRGAIYDAPKSGEAPPADQASSAPPTTQQAFNIASYLAGGDAL